jgi:hypothetical protein
MQTITSNGVSLYSFADADAVTVLTDKIETPSFIIGDLNSSNATLHLGVAPPADWAGGKYLFDGVVWVQNPAWVKFIDPELAASVRTERDALLAASDWTQVADAPVDQAAWAAYRQALRDVTAQAGFPDAVVWPVKPE